MREAYPHTPRKPNSRRNYLRPYGGERGTFCSCHLGVGSARMADGTWVGSVNHGNNTWRRAIRKVERKRARQAAQKSIFQELADTLGWSGYPKKVSYLYDQDEPDVIAYYDYELVEYNQKFFRFSYGNYSYR